MDGRDTFQATQTKLSSSLLLWKKCQYYKDTNLVYFDNQPTTNAD